MELLVERRARHSGERIGAQLELEGGRVVRRQSRVFARALREGVALAVPIQDRREPIATERRAPLDGLGAGRVLWRGRSRRAAFGIDLA